MPLIKSSWFPPQKDHIPKKPDHNTMNVKEISLKFQTYVGKGNCRFIKSWLMLSAIFSHYFLVANIAYLIQTRRQGAIYILAGYILSKIGIIVALYILFFRRKQVQSLLVKLFTTLDASDPLVLRLLFRKTRFIVITTVIFGTILAVVGMLDIMDEKTDNQYIFTADYYCFTCDPDQWTTDHLRIVAALDFAFYSYCVIACGILIATFYAFICMAIVSIAKKINTDLVTFKALDQLGPFIGTLRFRLRQLNGLIEEANSILQDIILFWYVITLFHTCYGATEAIKRAGSITILSFLYHFTLNCGDLITLMMVTYYASKIPEVLAESFDYVPFLVEHAITAGYQSEINLLYHQMGSLKNGIRLGGCFVITKNLFVSFTGLAITYGVIYIQLNPGVLQKLQNLGDNNSSCTWTCSSL